MPHVPAEPRGLVFREALSASHDLAQKRRMHAQHRGDSAEFSAAPALSPCSRIGPEVI